MDWFKIFLGKVLSGYLLDTDTQETGWQMAGDAKEEFPPLLPGGLHKMAAVELRAITVDKFPHSIIRKVHWENFLEVVEKLRLAGLHCEIWVDGSFLTEKIEPGDVDIVVDFPIATIEQLNDVQRLLIDDLKNRAYKIGKRLHTFVMFTAGQGHNFYEASRISHEQWQKDFGFSYLGKQPKGIAVIEVRP